MIRLRQRMTEDMQVRNLALNTQTYYLQQVSLFARHFDKSPEQLVDEILATPRLNTPRKRVAAGSVGIAERQTAAYPVVSPGGWNLIGRTPAKLFDRERDGYSLMQPGDTVRFEAVGHAEFIHLGGDDTPLEAQA